MYTAFEEGELGIPVRERAGRKLDTLTHEYHRPGIDSDRERRPELGRRLRARPGADRSGRIG
jgi:hypothetical protein